MNNCAFQAPLWHGILGSRAVMGEPAISTYRPFPTPHKVRGRRGRVLRVTSCTPVATQAIEEFTAKGMGVEDFFARSVGEWRSQRSSHNLAWTQFEQITSAISITRLEVTDAEVVELCEANKADPSDIVFSIKMAWEGESDWDDEVSEGESVMSVLKDGERHGRLLRSLGYAETIPAVGTWEMTADGVFVLNTLYDAAGAEERIWFATPDLRLRVSQIRTSSGKGVLTASFSSEIRRLSAV